MSIENYIKQNVSKVGSKVLIAPDIPEKKLNNAVSAIAPDVNPEYVVAIADISLFSNAKEGLVFLGDALHIRGTLEKPQVLKFETIERAEYICTETQKDNGKITKKEETVIHLLDNSKVSISYYGINFQPLANLINGIIEESGEDKTFTTTSQTMPLAQMEEDIKTAYIKLVCNFAYSDDGQVDAKEYAEITSLIARVELSVEKRIELRSYMYDTYNTEKNDDLLQYLNDHVPAGSFDIVKKSLIKDILYLFKLSHGPKQWNQNLFILELQKKLDLEDNQIELILSAIQSDEDILKQRKSDSEIKKTMKELAAKAGAVGVPMAAIYFSGSVIGLGATGITSGLAALGMGGILGLSGMVTGIGAALLIGVGAYKGIKKVTGISELENNKQREIMLQAIIRNSQKALNYLIEDVNEISQQLMGEVQNGLESALKIEKLSNILAMLSKGAQATTDKINHAEKESTMAQIPATLDLIRLQELTNQATKEKIRTFIMSCYKEIEVFQEDGSSQKQVSLDDQLSLDTLEHLYQCFESIGYLNVKDAALASAKGAAKSLVRNFIGQ